MSDNEMSELDSVSSAVNVTPTVNASVIYDDVMKQTWLRVVLISLYVVIFVLGVAGNSLVVYIVAARRAMQSITNIFIANLAVSDVIMCLLAVPFTPISGLLQSWPFGEALCHLVPMTMGVSVHVSTLTSTAIAVDRYFVIVHPFRPRMKSGVCLMLIGAIWFISVSISLPLAIYQKVSWEDTLEVYECHEQWPKDTARQFFTVVSLVLQYIVPCSIITFCYASVSKVLSRRAKTKIGKSSASVSRLARDQAEIQRKRRTNRMLIAMVSIFVCCWLPLNVMNVTNEYVSHLYEWPYFLLTFFSAHVVAMSSTVYNPFLYGWLNDNFQKEFRILLPCLFTVFSGGGGGGSGGKRLGIETTMVCVNPTAGRQSPAVRSETIRLHQLRSERNGCHSDEEKVLVEVTLDSVHHHNAADNDANDLPPY